MDISKYLSNFIIRTISAIALLAFVFYVWSLGIVWQERLILALSLMIFLEWLFLWGKVTKFKKGFLNSSLIFGLGTSYIIMAELGFWHMLHDPIYHALIVSIMIVLWVVDSGSYIVGSLLKGPKLAPSISAGKTWSGFVGGTGLGIVIGYYLIYSCPLFFHDKNAGFILTLFIPFLGQCGDLLESKVKRILNVKDSSSFIPGHGGLLDRLDSALMVFFIWQVYLLVR